MEAARRVYKLVSSSIERHRRERLVISTNPAPTDQPTVYFLTPDFGNPSGGIRVIYRHVDILNAAGVPAAVLHHGRNFRVKWFGHQTRTTNLSATVLKAGDLLVLTELDVDIIRNLKPGTRHVIFNQGTHLTWNRGGKLVNQQYLHNPDLVGVVVVSSHGEQVLRHAFPAIPVHRIHLGIDPIVFRLGEAPRDRRITYMPRRGSDDARSVLAMLEARGALRDWHVEPLAGLKQIDVAERLRNSRIFLSFSYQEGFGLPPAEAMACGAFVIGYHGFGGREYFLPEFSEPVEPGDILACARAVETAITRDRADPEWCRMRGRKASEFVFREYAQEREREDVLTLYQSFLRCIEGRSALRAR